MTKILADAAELEARHGLSMQAALRVAQGEIGLDEAVANQHRLRRGMAIFHLPDDQWPRVALHWDMEPAHFYRSMDDHDAESFACTFPDAEIGWVESDLLHAALVDTSRRIGTPFSERYRNKTATLFAHLESGGSVTPPAIVPQAKGLSVRGGNHRLGLARHLQVAMVPILYCAADRDAIDALVALKPPPVAEPGEDG